LLVRLSPGIRAIFFLLLPLWPLWRIYKQYQETEVKMMSETVLKIDGMTCMHCKMRVENALKGVPGVTGAQVDLGKKQAVVAGSAEQALMAKAVADAGFKVVG
jgi:copper chaperone